MSIVIKNISKKFGNVAAVQDVNLNIEEGELVALLGPRNAVGSRRCSLAAYLMKSTPLPI